MSCWRAQWLELVASAVPAISVGALLTTAGAACGRTTNHEIPGQQLAGGGAETGARNSGGAVSCEPEARSCVGSSARVCDGEAWVERVNCAAACVDGRCSFVSPGLGDDCAQYPLEIEYAVPEAFTCRLQAPSAMRIEPDSGRIAFLGEGGEELTTLPHVATAEECFDAPGWYFDPSPPALGLCEATCAAPPSLRLRIELKCNTLE